jgi:tetratricopeptide (TPR) repeat protein
MAHCPYCGTIVKDEEQYCIKCGKELPKDIEERMANRKFNNKWWFIPVASVVVFSLLFLGLYMYTNNQKENAISAYESGAKLAEEGNFQQAKEQFEQAVNLKTNMKAAVQNAQFMDIAMSIQKELASAEKLLEENAFQQGIALTKQSEEKLKNYDGVIVNNLLDQIMVLRSKIKTEELKYLLKQKPSIQDLKILLWQAETIQNEEAKAMTKDIRKRLVDYTYSMANETMKLKQYSDAIAIINDGLRYAPNSEKLKSLKTTIEKEKIAFETEQQQRIAQAMDAAEKEYEMNKNDAVEIISIESSKDEYGDLVVKGVIKSVATVPIYSISVEYNLLNSEDEVIASNVVFLYPDTLYPDEEGKFEFVHYELDQELTPQIERVQWFLNSP